MTACELYMASNSLDGVQFVVNKGPGAQHDAHLQITFNGQKLSIDFLCQNLRKLRVVAQSNFL